jgi:hypothetical protein
MEPLERCHRHGFDLFGNFRRQPYFDPAPIRGDVLRGGAEALNDSMHPLPGHLVAARCVSRFHSANQHSASDLDSIERETA